MSHSCQAWECTGNEKCKNATNKNTTKKRQKCQKLSMSKGTKFLLEVNYRIRQDQYKLRRLARAALEKFDGGDGIKEFRELNECLREFDQQDMLTWNALVKRAIEGDKNEESS